MQTLDQSYETSFISITAAASVTHPFLVDGGVRGESDALVAQLRVVHPAVRVAVVREVVLAESGQNEISSQI